MVLKLSQVCPACSTGAKYICGQVSAPITPLHHEAAPWGKGLFIARWSQGLGHVPHHTLVRPPALMLKCTWFGSKACADKFGTFFAGLGIPHLFATILKFVPVIKQWPRRIMLQCYNVTMLQCYNVTMAASCYTLVLKWENDRPRREARRRCLIPRGCNNIFATRARRNLSNGAGNERAVLGDVNELQLEQARQKLHSGEHFGLGGSSMVWVRLHEGEERAGDQ